MHPSWTFIKFRNITTGQSQPSFSDALQLCSIPLLELCVPQTLPYAPEVSPHKTCFQQIPYLLSRECLQQLKILSAWSGRLMVIIKAVLSSPLLFFTELLGSREQGCARQQEPWKVHVQRFGVYYLFGLLVCPHCWVKLSSLWKPPGKELPDNCRSHIFPFALKKPTSLCDVIQSTQTPCVLICEIMGNGSRTISFGIKNK